VCQFTRIRLTHAEQEEVKKLSGIMIPIYASVALALIAFAVVAHLPRSGEPMAIAKTDIAAPQR